ncbi:unnamed protein product [Cercospora beticola]|nr:unnamed protein product [Cercospora beticola]
MASDSDNGDGNGDDSLKLRELIEGLPQELQDIIYDMTFTADPKVHICAWKRYVRDPKLKDAFAEYSARVVEFNKQLHPHLLWVDRHSRQKFASSYYGRDSVFVLPEFMWRYTLVGGGMDPAFASRIIFNKHDEVLKLVKQRAGIPTEDAEVSETTSEGEEKAED